MARAEAGPPGLARQARPPEAARPGPEGVVGAGLDGYLHAEHYQIPKGAEPLLRRALAIVEKDSGPEAPETTAALGYLCAIPGPRWLGIDPRWGVAGLTASAGVAGWVEFTLLRRGLNRRIGPTGVPAPLVARWVSQP